MLPATIFTPFGYKKPIYVDFTASGRPLPRIETFVQENVMKCYGNTHTGVSWTGLQCSNFRQEAREVVKTFTGANSCDEVLFCGCGTTSALETLVRILGLQKGGDWEKRASYEHTCPLCGVKFSDPESLKLHQRAEHLDGEFSSLMTELSLDAPLNSAAIDTSRPIVFVDEAAHHSNLLAWRESQAQVVICPSDATFGSGAPDLGKLKELLTLYSDSPLKIGAFTVCSNVTGMILDIQATTALLHEFGAIACFDAATSAPHRIGLQMNPCPTASGVEMWKVGIDALCFSPHKFLGGPGSSGVLVLKKSLMNNHVPSTPAGGTVFFVGPDRTRYAQVLSEREEGGTPNILGDIRVGLTLLHHQELSAEKVGALERKQTAICQALFSRLSTVHSLGSPSAPRVPVFALMFPCAAAAGKRYLHWGFVTALLNDLFGVQCRGGCLCCGPYVHKLLGIDRATSRKLENGLLLGHHVLRPGVVRIGFASHMSSRELLYTLCAVAAVAQWGWRLLSYYQVLEGSGEWKHIAWHRKIPTRKWLQEMITSRAAEKMPDNSSGYAKESEESAGRRRAYLERAIATVAPLLQDEAGLTAEWLEQLCEGVTAMLSIGAGGGGSMEFTPESQGGLPEGFEPMRWYCTPGDFEYEKMNLCDPEEIVRLASIASTVRACVDGGIQGVPTADPVPLTLIQTGPAPPPAVLPSCPFVAPPGPAGPAECLSCAFGPTEEFDESGEEEEEETATEGAVKVTETRCEPVAGVPFVIREEEQPCMATGLPVVTYTAFPVSGPFSDTPLYRKEAAFPPLEEISPAIMRRLFRGVKEFGMIKKGDRILVGLSGGKDSLSLLHCLVQLQRQLRHATPFSLGAITVDPMAPGYDPSQLKGYLLSLGIPYIYKKTPILERAHRVEKMRSICAFCSRIKRGVLYKAARTYGYNSLVLAHHADDIVESFMMSAFHNGALNTMKANYLIGTEDLHVIRPALFLRERELLSLSTSWKLPVLTESCPACFQAPQERYRMKMLLASQEHQFPQLMDSMLKALRPLMTISTAKA